MTQPAALKPDFDDAARTLSEEFYKAVDKNDIDEAMDLLEQGAEPQGKGFIMAAGRGECSLVKRMIEKGAAIDAVNKFGYTALMSAISGKRVDVVQLLIESGADTAIRNNEGETAGVLAEARGHKSIIQLLDDAPAIRQRALDETEARKNAAMHATASSRQRALRGLHRLGNNL
jgi:ankyrin repeat protein